MKNKNEVTAISRAGFIAVAIASLSLIACNRPTEVVKSTVISQTSNGREEVQVNTTEAHRNAKGRLVVEKHTVHEKATCVDSKGALIKVTNFEDCIKKGGKVIEEETVKDFTYKK